MLKPQLNLNQLAAFSLIHMTSAVEYLGHIIRYLAATQNPFVDRPDIVHIAEKLVSLQPDDALIRLLQEEIHSTINKYSEQYGVMDLLMGESEIPNQVSRKVSFESGLPDEYLLQSPPTTQQPKQEENLDSNQMETTVQEAQLAIRTRNDSNDVSRNYLEAGSEQEVKSGDLPSFSKENSIEGEYER